MENKTVFGYAVKFGIWSKPIFDKDLGVDVIERVLKSAITEEFLLTQFIECRICHNNNEVLATWNKGKGDLILGVDDTGFWYKFNLDLNNPIHQKFIQLRKQGKLTESSYKFYLTDDMADYEFGTDGTVKRTIKQFLKITDVSIVLNPANNLTSSEVKNSDDVSLIKMRDNNFNKYYEELRKNVLPDLYTEESLKNQKELQEMKAKYIPELPNQYNIYGIKTNKEINRDNISDKEKRFLERMSKQNWFRSNYLFE